MSRRAFDRHLPRRRLCAAALCALLATGLAQGEDSTGRLTFEELADVELTTSDRVRLAGEYVELRDDEVLLRGLDARCVIRSREVRRSILQLSTEHRNLTLEVVPIDLGAKPPIFEILRVESAPETATLLREEVDRLVGKDAPSPRHLLGIGSRILALDDPTGAYRNQVVRALTQALRAHERSLAADDIAGRLEFVDEILEVSGDRRLALELLAELEKRFPTSRAPEERLTELGCRRFRGRWMLYEDFKRLQGFEQYRNVWVSHAEKDFLETLVDSRTGERELILRRRTDAEYRLLAQRGQVDVGMTPQEVQKALGYPERVYREILGEREYDQWVYGDRYCYFEDGVLFRISALGGEGKR